MIANPAHSFDAVADDYDRYRPPYPDALYRDLLEAAALPERARVLEIGAGSGIASLPFARRGFRLECLEPGAELSLILRRKLSEFPDCAVHSLAFEEWAVPQGQFELVYSAQAFHWLDPDSRFERVASCLTENGVLAVFGNALVDARGPSENELRAAYEGYAPELQGPSPTMWYAAGGPVPQLFRSSGYFSDPMVRYYDWEVTYGRDEYLSLLSTHSGYRLLPDRTRNSLLSEIGRAVDLGERSVAVKYQSSLFLARRITSECRRTSL